MGLAPNQIPPEKAPQSFAEKAGANVARRGPLRFEEGIATDTFNPDDFQQGMSDGYRTAPDSPNHNSPDAQYKHAAQVMQERAHVGSASWVDAPPMLRDFVAGVTEPPVTFPQVDRGEGRKERRSATVIGSENPNTPYDRL
jgi:hypothetical protein